MERKKLMRQQLDAALFRLHALRDQQAPQKGWVQAVRMALGMSARQLAGRLGVSQQAVARIEKEESSGKVTIKTLRRIAEGLDCVFVYGFVPRTSLNETVTRQARRVALDRLARVSHTMNLERQGLGAAENETVLSEMVDEIVRTMPPSLWDE